MAKTLTQQQFADLRRQLDKATTPQDLQDAASGYGVALTSVQLDAARRMAGEEVAAAESRFISDGEQHELAEKLRGIQNGGIRVSSQFVSYVIYYGAIASVVTLFLGEVWRLTPVIAPMLDTHPLVAVIPTAMILIGYYITALIGKAARKTYADTIITKRLLKAADKYLNSETLTTEEERDGRIAAEIVRKYKSAGRGYGMVEWALFVGLHALTAYHTAETHTGDGALMMSVGASVGLIFLLMIVSKMLVTHIYVTSQKSIVTGVQGFDRASAYEDAYGRVLYRAIVSKASAQIEQPANPTQARIVELPTSAPKTHNGTTAN